MSAVGNAWWDYLTTHKDNIRECVVCYGADVEAFDTCFTASADTKLEAAKILCSVMNAAWFNAPDSRRVYDVPGFRELCNLLDGSVEDDYPYG